MDHKYNPILKVDQVKRLCFGGQLLIRALSLFYFGVVFLNSRQTKIKSNGDPETLGGRLTLSTVCASARATVLDTLNYEGNTYVLVVGHPTLGYPSIKPRVKLYVDRARNFALSQNGDLAVYSNDAEARRDQCWFGDLNTAVNANDADILMWSDRYL